MFRPINPIAGFPGFYGAFETLDNEGARAGLREEQLSALVERRSSTAEDCPTCFGRGVVRRENVGCETCHGRGIINE